MKKIYKHIGLALATMMTSCLTEDPRDQLYEEDIYNNANNIYILMQWLCSTITFGAVQTVRALPGRGIYDYNTHLYRRSHDTYSWWRLVRWRFGRI